jgi:Holliday junction resolvase RusA-like endonuclease
MSTKIIDIKPEPKPRMTRSDKWKERPAVMRYRAFCDELRLKLGSWELPAQLEIEFHIPVFKSWSEKKVKEMLGKPHQQTPDIDNYLKAVLDALCNDDSYIYDLRGSKYWCAIGKEKIIIRHYDNGYKPSHKRSYK